MLTIYKVTTYNKQKQKLIFYEVSENKDFLKKYPNAMYEAIAEYNKSIDAFEEIN